MTQSVQTDIRMPNKPAAPNTGIASQLTIEHHRPGVGEPERSSTDMTRLPQHICVQLLAGVAAELRPTIDGFADRDTLGNIDHSISQARTAAKGDLPRSDLEESSITATILTGKLELFLQGLFLHEADRESKLGRLTPEQLVIVRDVADSQRGTSTLTKRTSRSRAVSVIRRASDFARQFFLNNSVKVGRSVKVLHTILTKT